MPFARVIASGAVLLTLSLSLAAAACDSGSAGDEAPNDTRSNGSEPSARDADKGNEAASPVAALALSSCIPASYVLPLRIGDSEPFDVTLDTGSTSLAVASSSCSGCDVEPKFSPKAGVKDRKQRAEARYAIGRWTGKVYEGEVSLDPQTRASVEFVAIEEQEDFFVRQTCGSKSGGVQGIIGFGPRLGAVRGTTGFFDRFVAESKVPDIFATSLCDRRGTLWLGGYDATQSTGAPQYTPLLSGALTYYAVRLANIEVEGTVVPVASRRYPRTVVDTGASVFLLPSAALSSLAKAIAASPGFEQLVGEDASWFDNPDGLSCKELITTKRDLDARLPPLTLTFGTEEDAITVRAAPTESYLANHDGRWCSTLAAFDPSPDLPVASVMGAPVMRSNIVIFDRENDRIGFAPHKPCE